MSENSSFDFILQTQTHITSYTRLSCRLMTFPSSSVDPRQVCPAHYSVHGLHSCSGLWVMWAVLYLEHHLKLQHSLINSNKFIFSFKMLFSRLRKLVSQICDTLMCLQITPKQFNAKLFGNYALPSNVLNWSSGRLVALIQVTYGLMSTKTGLQKSVR